MSTSSLPPQSDGNDPTAAAGGTRPAGTETSGTLSDAPATDLPSRQGPVGAAGHHAPGDTSDLPKLVPGGARYLTPRRQRSTAVPFDDADQPQPFYRKPIVWILGALGLCIAIAAAVVIPLAITANNHGADDDAAARFTAELAEFDSAWTVDAVQASAVSGIGVTWETKYRETDQPERARNSVTQHCTELESSRSAYDALAAVPIPSLAASESGSPSAAYQDAAARAESRAALFAAAQDYRTNGSAQFDALDSICGSLVKFSAATAAQDQATEATVAPLTIAPEESEQVKTTTGTATFTCTSEEPCEPLSSPTREEYASALATVSATFDADVTAVFRDSCPAVELDGYCSQAVDTWGRIAQINQETQQRYIKEEPLRSSVPLPEYTSWLTSATDEEATLQDALDSWMTTTFPDLVVAENDSPFVSYLMDSADAHERELTQLRSATVSALHSV